MSRLPPELARRIDRLARHAHRFHRYAHHPRCAAYAGEVVPLGRRLRICRGCALASLGAVIGTAAGLLAPPLVAATWLAGPPLLAGWAVVALARRTGRPRSKWFTRTGPLALATFLVVAGLRGGVGADSWSGLGVAALTMAVVGLGLLRYRRRGPDRTACTGCPQGPPGPRCDGFRGAVRRERAFSRLAARWMARARSGSCETSPP
jgi:hypothetical protein